MSAAAHLPVVDIAGFMPGDHDPGDHGDAAAQIDVACREIGFFGVVGHGLDQSLLDDLDRAARTFFALPDETKSAISMTAGRRAWRGWFPLYGEVTSGLPDGKEGLYFGIDHPPDHPRVLDGSLLHGANLYPADPPGLEPAVVAWIGAVRPLADAVMSAIAVGLGLDAGWFTRHLTADPMILFRIFHYPPSATTETEWGVAEHTDYGLLTLLAQDAQGGLEVRHRDGSWIEVEPTPGVIICNIGDMLERLTRGRYRSTPHRVRNTSGISRLSFPYFFDPSWDATVPTLPLGESTDTPTDTPTDTGGEQDRRWDGGDPVGWDGLYGDYLSAKVAKVFGDLM